MKSSKSLFQLIAPENGYRSEPMLMDINELRKFLKEGVQKDDTLPNAYILRIGDVNDDQGLMVTCHPLVHVSSFLELEVQP